MTMKEKLDAIQNIQDYEVEVEEKLVEIIKNTYDYHCISIENIIIDNKNVEVTYMYRCCSEDDSDVVVIPRKWLDDGFDYKAAYEEMRRKAEEARKKEEAEEKKRAEERKSKAEYEQYLKLKAKYEQKT